jgi:hypothetical protein
VAALAPWRSERAFGVALVALAGISAASVLYGTSLGIGLLNDSVNYLRAARGLLDGRGLVVMQAFHYAGAVPMTHWPPLYPLLLAAAGWLGLDMEAFARALHALLLAANVLLVGRFAAAHGGGRAGALFAALLFATSCDVLFVHQIVLTEPLYLFTALLSLSLLARHLESPRPALVWSAGIAAALALMTRYVGIAVVGAGGLGLLLLLRQPLAARVRDAIRFGAPTAAALALWTLRNRGIDAPSYGEWNESLPALAPLLPPLGAALADWVWPFQTELAAWRPWSALLAALTVVSGLAALALVAAGARRPRAGDGDGARDLRPALLLALYALLHMAFLYGTVLAFFDAFVPDTRHLLPAMVALVLALVCVVPPLAAAAPRPKLCALALALAALALIAAHTVRGARYQIAHAQLGFGFREPRYAHSGLIALARSLPAGTPVFTNSQAVAGLARMEDMRFLPAKRWPQRTQPNPDYEAQLRDMERELRERHGVIVVFAGVGNVFPRADELARELPLRLLYAEPQGQAFALRTPRSGPPLPGLRAR